MNSQLILGCKTCEHDLIDQKGVTYAFDGSIQLPFSTQVAYRKEDLTDLFLNHFTCPFCGDKLEITPNMMKLVTDFLNKVFHTAFMKEAAEVTNGELSFYIPYEEKIKSVTDFLNSRSVTLINAKKYLPTINDILLIQKVAQEFDPAHWRLRVESSFANSEYISNFGLWFNGFDL